MVRRLTLAVAVVAALANAMPAHAITAPSTITISFVGDTELGNTPILPAKPYHYLDPVKSALHAAVGFANLEGTLTNGGYSKCGVHSTECYAFRTPPYYAQVLRSDGLTVLNSANNHSHDFGSVGVSDTSRAMTNAAIIQAGLPGQIGLVRDGEIKVAFVDFAPYSNTNDLLRYGTAATLIARARREAAIVIVYMHAGAEGSSATHVTGREEYYVGEDRGNARRFAHAAIDDGANLVIASGPHVLRGMEFYKHRLIAYSLGDFANYENFGLGGVLSESAILKVTLSSAGTYVAAHVDSVILRGAGRPYLDPTHAAAHLITTLSHEDFGPAGVSIAPSGAVIH